MKQLIFSIILSLTAFIGCSREVKYEVFSSEAFAFKLPEGWELNTTARVKDFHLKENEGIYSCDLSYHIDIYGPSGFTISKADTGLIQKSSGDEFDEFAIDIQIELDDGFEMGTYKIIYFVNDNLNNKLVTDTTTFDLARE